MKSFGIKRDEKDPRWFGKFIPWGNNNDPHRKKGFWKAQGYLFLYYGFNEKGFVGEDRHNKFDRIITLDEWEAEFMTKSSTKNFDAIEARIKDALLERGFLSESILNNRGLIGATIEECQYEFMTKLAGREYDERLLNEFKINFCDLKIVNETQEDQSAKEHRYFMFGDSYIEDFINYRYAKQDRIAEIKAEIEKLSNELKELEG